MFQGLPPLTITDDEPVPLIDPALLFFPSPGANNAAELAGYSILLITDGELFVGGDDVTAGNTSSFAAGRFTIDLHDDEVPYGIAPSGQQVVVKRWASGLKNSGFGNLDAAYDNTSFDIAGFDTGGYDA